MTDKLVGIPPQTATLLLFGSVLIGALVEWRQGYIGRPAIIANAILLWQVFYADWVHLPDYLQYYLNAGTVIGVVALGSYVLKFPMRSIFYTIAIWGYGSLSILFILIAWVHPWS